MRTEQACGTPILSDVYAPIAADLARSEQLFRDELVSDQDFINELYTYVELFHGKRVRPALLLLAAKACGEIRPVHDVLAAVVEMVHMATLVHDDVLDDGELRRRTATVNRRWGNERAVLLGDILFSHAYRLCSQRCSQEAAGLIARTGIRMCEGEMLQIANRDNHELTEQQYLECITAKTAALIGTCTLLGARHAGADERTCERMQQFGLSLGIAFQVTDDLLDLIGDETVAGKSLGRDAQHGELTLPLIHFLRENPPDRCSELRAALTSNGPDGARRIARLLEQSDSIAHAQQFAHAHVHEALAILAGLGPSDARNSLGAVAEFVLARRF